MCTAANATLLSVAGLRSRSRPTHALAPKTPMAINAGTTAPI
jgi:hypothetical protein